MSRVAYVDGRYLPHQSAAVHIEDRGLQFGDAVYEVCEVRDGRLVDFRRHMDRLDRSLKAVEIRAPMPRGAMLAVAREVVARNRVRDGLVYLQVTRGVAPRDHGFPAASVRPSLIMTARPALAKRAAATAAAGVAVITVPETRWARVDIKTTNLLANVLAKEAARRAGAAEAWFVDRDGRITEGASTNAWIVTASGTLVTRPADDGILRGITRTVLFDVARELGLAVEERPFALAEALAAREAFITAATTIVMPVVRIDGNPVGEGKPGPVATHLRASYHRFAEAVGAAADGRAVAE